MSKTPDSEPSKGEPIPEYEDPPREIPGPEEDEPIDGGATLVPVTPELPPPQ